MSLDVSEAQVLAARSAHPERGARRLTRVLFPDLDDERELVRLASKVGRILRKHDAPAVRGADDEEPAVVPEPPVAATRAPSTPLDTVRADIAELRESMTIMKRDGSWQAYTGAMRLVQGLEEKRLGLEAQQSTVRPEDITPEYVIARLRKMPRPMLLAALEPTD